MSNQPANTINSPMGGKQRTKSEVNKIYHSLYILILLTIITIPIASTGIYAISGNWSQSILPESWTFQWLLQIWTDERFLWACFYSF